MSATRDKELEAAVEEYRRDHWGRRGPLPGIRALVAADPRRTAIELGGLVRLTYLTKKGTDKEQTEYEHDFSTPLPVLAYEPRTSLLVIFGGNYHVEARGIVG